MAQLRQMHGVAALPFRQAEDTPWRQGCGLLPQKVVGLLAVSEAGFSVARIPELTWISGDHRVLQM
jgi:hypothetical protein